MQDSTTPGFWLRVTRALAAGGIAIYVVRAVQQLAALRSDPLRWDFSQFYDAAATLQRGGDPYRAFLDACPAHHWCPGGYIFPPLVAEVLRPITILPKGQAAIAWLLLSHALLLGTAVVVRRALRGMLTPTSAALLLAAATFFLPLYESLYFLQVGALLLLLLALAAAAHVRQRDAQSGTWIATAAIARVTPVLLLPALVSFRRAGRGQWVARTRGLVFAGLVGAAIMVVLGLLTPATVHYFVDVLPRISGGTIGLDNISVPGFVARAAVLWGMPDPSGTGITVVSTAVFVGLTWATVQLTAGDSRDRARLALVFGAFLAAMPLASSITWRHHLITELLAYALVTPALLLAQVRRARFASMATALVVASYPMISLTRHATDSIAIGLGLLGRAGGTLVPPTGLRVPPFLLVTGINLMGMLALWVAALVLLRAGRGEDIAGEERRPKLVHTCARVEGKH